ncbi:hypothetical protein AHMF7616_03673 [Adhaeribacter pallidiroseus]|uniref:Uncharacterized protein n=1 Tax=Adhaeribacter pallidiroseus TaxID=2072847 RepID=A0A369QL33_9BACT|nr:hypothetical protein AHMF7616_03673 [Adhaeribacter pallidiroseus]
MEDILTYLNELDLDSLSRQELEEYCQLIAGLSRHNPTLIEKSSLLLLRVQFERRIIEIDKFQVQLLESFWYIPRYR